MTPDSGPPRERISVCLIVQDEQRDLPGALDSVSFCDEIVVVDGGSTDRTVQIARERGATLIENPWPGFAVQRNVALDAATSEWVLELDADERVSSRLRSSIEELLAAPPEGVAIAVCPLRHWFLGRLLGPSAKYPAYRSRLFRRGAYRHDELRGVHEGLEPRERPATLEGDLEHTLATTPGEALHDAWRYAKLESRQLQRPSNRGAYLKGIALRPAGKIIYRTLVDGGWRDGWQGILKIVLDAASDALVWTRVLLGADRKSDGRETDPAATAATNPTAFDIASTAKLAEPSTGDSTRHFGRRPAGSAKVVALAGRGGPTQAARSWLQELQSEGVDVALVSDDGELGGDLPTQRLSRLWPLAAMRALDVEMQIRTIHAVVPVGRRAKFVWRLLPGTLRPAIPGLNVETDSMQVHSVTSLYR